MFAFERVERRETVTAESLWRGSESAPYKVTNRRATITRYTVTGVEAITKNDRPPLYRKRAEPLFVPVSVTVQEYETGHPTVVIGGRQQLKSGKLSAVVRDLYKYAYARSEWPEWLAEIVADAQSGVKA